jgi:hypothetical protein
LFLPPSRQHVPTAASHAADDRDAKPPGKSPLSWFDHE